MFLRLYTGDDGQSHMEDLDMEAGEFALSKMHDAISLGFRKQEVGYFSDWHHAPRRQFIITLTGGVEIGLGDGSVHRLGAGDVMLAEDLTGQGHTTRAVGDEARYSVVIPVD